jgi:hypothetical protein
MLKGTFQVQPTGRRPKITVSSDGKGIVGQAGGLLLMETLRVTGLDQGLSQALERWRPSRAVHDPGKIMCDLAVMLALGGDCLADIAILRAAPELFGSFPPTRRYPGWSRHWPRPGPKRCGRSARPARGRGHWRASAHPAPMGT